MQFTYLSYFPLHNTAPFERPSLDKKPISSHCINTALYVCGRVLPSHGEGESKVLHHCNQANYPQKPHEYPIRSFCLSSTVPHSLTHSFASCDRRSSADASLPRLMVRRRSQSAFSRRTTIGQCTWSDRKLSLGGPINCAGRHEK